MKSLFIFIALSVLIVFGCDNDESNNSTSPPESSEEELPIISMYDFGGLARGIVVSGNYAYLADNNYGLRIIDISDPSNPVIAGGYETDESARGIGFSGDSVYMGHGGTMSGLDISTPSNPVAIGGYSGLSYPIRRIWSLAIHGNYAYISTYGLAMFIEYEGQILIVDISNGPNYEDITHDENVYIVWDIFVDNYYYYLADYMSGIRICDNQNLAYIYTLGILPLPAITGIYAIDTLLFVVDNITGMKILDITDVENLREISSLSIPGVAMDVVVSEGYAYISTYDQGLQIIDISIPEVPEIVAYANTGQATYEAYIANGFVYVTDDYNGLVILSVIM